MLHMGTLQHKQVKCQKRHLKILSGREGEDPRAEAWHMELRAEGWEKQIPFKLIVQARRKDQK